MELPGLAAHRPVGTNRQEVQTRGWPHGSAELKPDRRRLKVSASRGPVSGDHPEQQRRPDTRSCAPRPLVRAPTPAEGCHLDLPPTSLHPSSAAPPAAPGTHLHVCLTSCDLRGQPGPSAPTASAQRGQPRFRKNERWRLRSDVPAGQGPAPQGHLHDSHEGPTDEADGETPHTAHGHERGCRKEPFNCLQSFVLTSSSL